jgi:hypothetical protein
MSTKHTEIYVNLCKYQIKYASALKHSRKCRLDDLVVRIFPHQQGHHLQLECIAYSIESSVTSS